VALSLGVKLGYTDVRVLSAGIGGWPGAKLPFDSGKPLV
jgi:hypothetical protein